ncbi:hypothetical protein [Lysinibacillus xylanilyticus]|uniref:hypothetical protein n=1 Tax=Lysinibacillus xylanilyticus TaxID=582475 RepID=UPI003CFD9008
MTLLKRLKDYAWEMIIVSGGLLLLFIFIIYFRAGFDKTTFWQSVLPSAFVDIISVLVTTFLLSYLLNKGREYKFKKQFYEIIKMQQISVFYQLENDYLSILTTKKDEAINNESDISLQEIPEYIDTLNDDFFKEEIYIYKESDEKITRGKALWKFNISAKNVLIGFYCEVFEHNAR